MNRHIACEKRNFYFLMCLSTASALLYCPEQSRMLGLFEEIPGKKVTVILENMFYQEKIIIGKKCCCIF